MFGFGRLAAYDYFTHVERALSERLRAAGDEVQIHVVHVSPTASIRRRAAKLVEKVASTCDLPTRDRGPIHLIGHSTGGLDARLAASPSVSLSVAAEALAWRSRLASVTMMNTPHYGTPLASFFTTVSGGRALRALSALTVIALTIGSPPLSAMSALVAAFERGPRLKVLDHATNALLRGLDAARSREVRDYVDAMTEDNGAMVQLMPEAMDLFAAGIEDRAGVLYQATASMAPPPSARSLLRGLVRPRHALSQAMFTTLYGITSRADARYPCAAPSAGEDSERVLAGAFGRVPGVRANDGVVPIRSQIWGKLVWAGHADHLDVLGHYSGEAAEGSQTRHVDWLCSGSDFDRARFESLMDAIAGGLVSSATDGREGPEAHHAAPAASQRRNCAPWQ